MKYNVKKRGAVEVGALELIGLVLSAILILFIAVFVYKLLYGSATEEQASKANFINLGLEIDRLLEEPTTFSKVKSMPLSLGREFVFMGFDKGESGTTGIREMCNDEFRGKPEMCGESACICLYNANSWEEAPGKDQTELSKGLVDCKKFPEVNFIASRQEEVKKNVVETMGGQKVAPMINGLQKELQEYEYFVIFGGSEEFCDIMYGIGAEPLPWKVQTVYIEKFIYPDNKILIYLAKETEQTKKRAEEIISLYGIDVYSLNASFNNGEYEEVVKQAASLVNAWRKESWKKEQIIPENEEAIILIAARAQTKFAELVEKEMKYGEYKLALSWWADLINYYPTSKAIPEARTNIISICKVPVIKEENFKLCTEIKEEEKPQKEEVKAEEKKQMTEVTEIISS